jgi:hypothetical protein
VDTAGKLERATARVGDASEFEAALDAGVRGDSWAIARGSNVAGRA